MCPIKIATYSLLMLLLAAQAATAPLTTAAAAACALVHHQKPDRLPAEWDDKLFDDMWMMEAAEELAAAAVQRPGMLDAVSLCSGGSAAIGALAADALLPYGRAHPAELLLDDELTALLRPFAVEVLAAPANNATGTMAALQRQIVAARLVEHIAGAGLPCGDSLLTEAAGFLLRVDAAVEEATQHALSIDMEDMDAANPAAFAEGNAALEAALMLLRAFNAAADAVMDLVDVAEEEDSTASDAAPAVRLAADAALQGITHHLARIAAAAGHVGMLTPLTLGLPGDMFPGCTASHVVGQRARDELRRGALHAMRRLAASPAVKVWVFQGIPWFVAAVADSACLQAHSMRLHTVYSCKCVGREQQSFDLVARSPAEGACWRPALCRNVAVHCSTWHPEGWLRLPDCVRK